jgi:hypothetical protein
MYYEGVYAILVFIIILFAVLQPRYAFTNIEKILLGGFIVVSAYYDPTTSLLVAIFTMQRILQTEDELLEKAFRRKEKFEEDICKPPTKTDRAKLVKEDENTQSYYDEIKEISGITEDNLKRAQGEFIENTTSVNPCEINVS